MKPDSKTKGTPNWAPLGDKVGVLTMEVDDNNKERLTYYQSGRLEKEKDIYTTLTLGRKSHSVGSVRLGRKMVIAQVYLCK